MAVPAVPPCPRCGAIADVYGILVYQCEVHGEWHLGPGGLYDPKNPPPGLRNLL
jgi:hypothetical protein